jgi:hypothetical protein
MDFELADREAELLGGILRSYLSELRGEVVRTDRFDLRQTLKREEEEVKGLLARLEVSVPAAR